MSSFVSNLSQSWLLTQTGFEPWTTKAVAGGRVQTVRMKQASLGIHCVVAGFVVSRFSLWAWLPYKIELVHDKTYNRTCLTSKDLDQPVHPPSIVRVLVYPSLDGPEAVEGTCDQGRLWSDCADAQAVLSLCWSHKFYCRFCHAFAHNNTTVYILNTVTIYPVICPKFWKEAHFKSWWCV